MQTKICKECKQELPATSEYYDKLKSGKYGINSKCKACRKQYREENKNAINEQKKQYYKKNIVRIKEYNKQFRKDRADEIKEYKSQYYKKNTDRMININKKYYINNKEKINKQKKQYFKNNEDKFKKLSKQYYKENINKIKERVKQYQKENPEVSVRESHKRRAMKKQLPCTLTANQWQKIKYHFDNVCAYCGKKAKLTQEHFIPISKGGGYTKDNIIPACISCNCSKQDTYFYQWYPSHEHYNKQREQKIYDYLESVKGTKQLSLI
jgi:hypothetical protein